MQAAHASPLVQALAIEKLTVWANMWEHASVRQLLADSPNVDTSWASTADRLAADKLFEQSIRLSGSEFVDASGAASGCVVGDAVTNGNLAKLQPWIRSHFPASALAQTEGGMVYVNALKNRKGSYEQSFKLLALHQQEIIAHVDAGEGVAAGLQRFNGSGARYYYFTAGAERGEWGATAKYSPAYGATMMALMFARRDRNNPQFAEIRALVESVCGEDAAAYPLSTRVAAGIVTDPFARYFGADLHGFSQF